MFLESISADNINSLNFKAIINFDIFPDNKNYINDIIINLNQRLAYIVSGFPLNLSYDSKYSESKDLIA